jgi:phage gpG-like protein
MGGKGAGSRYGPLLSGRSHLARSIEYTPGDRQVTVFTRVSYAGIHNRGGTLHPSVTPKMRRFAWAQHYREAGKDKKKDTFWKRLALTKKTKLNIQIPQRQFMPTSTPGPELARKVDERFLKELKRIINT